MNTYKINFDSDSDVIKAARREYIEAEAAQVWAMDEMNSAGQKFTALMVGNKQLSPEKLDMVKRISAKAAEARKSFDEATERLEMAKIRLDDAIESDPNALSEVDRAADASPKSNIVIFFAATSIKAALKRGKSVRAKYEIQYTPAGYTFVILTPDPEAKLVVRLVRAEGGIELPDSIKVVAGFASNHGRPCLLIEGPEGAPYVERGYIGRQRWDRTL